MASDVPRYSHIPKHSSHLVVVQSADPGHQQGGARQRKSTTSNNTNTSTIRAQAPSFRDMQFCTGGGYFFGRLGRGSEPVFARFRRQRQAVEEANQAPGLSFSNSCSWGMGACTHHDEHETAYRSHHCDDAPHGQFWQCSSWCRYRMGMCIRRWTLPRLGHWGAKSSNGGRHGAECATDT